MAGSTISDRFAKIATETAWTKADLGTKCFTLYIATRASMFGCDAQGILCFNLSNEKAAGCFGYIGDYTIQLYRDYNKPI